MAIRFSRLRVAAAIVLCAGGVAACGGAASTSRVPAAPQRTAAADGADILAPSYVVPAGYTRDVGAISVVRDGANVTTFPAALQLVRTASGTQVAYGGKTVTFSADATITVHPNAWAALRKTGEATSSATRHTSSCSYPATVSGIVYSFVQSEPNANGTNFTVLFHIPRYTVNGDTYLTRFRQTNASGQTLYYQQFDLPVYAGGPITGGEGIYSPSDGTNVYHSTVQIDGDYNPNEPPYSGSGVITVSCATPTPTPAPTPTPDPAGSSWQNIGGNATDVAVGASGDVWALGPPTYGADQSIYHMVSGAWQNVAGSAKDIAVAPDGSPWVVNANGAIFHLVGGAWQSIGGNATDIAVGANGDVWALGPPSTGQDQAVYHLVNGAWQNVGGGATDIAVGPDGSPWAVNASGAIFHMASGSWQNIAGSATDIAVGANGAVWALGATPYGNGYAVLRWTGSGWQTIGGSAVDISVGPDGLPWAVDSTTAIYQRVR